MCWIHLGSRNRILFILLRLRHRFSEICMIADRNVLTHGFFTFPYNISARFGTDGNVVITLYITTALITNSNIFQPFQIVTGLITDNNMRSCQRNRTGLFHAKTGLITDRNSGIRHTLCVMTDRDSVNTAAQSINFHFSIHSGRIDIFSHLCTLTDGKTPCHIRFGTMSQCHSFFCICLTFCPDSNGVFISGYNISGITDGNSAFRLFTNLRLCTDGDGIIIFLFLNFYAITDTDGVFTTCCKAPFFSAGGNPNRTFT